MSKKRNVEDIILSSRNDKLLKSIRSTQLREQNVSASVISSMRYLGGSDRSQRTLNMISPSTSVLDTLVQRLAEFEHTLNTFKESPPISAAVTKRIVSVETVLHDRIQELKLKLIDIEMRLKDNVQSFATREEYLEKIEERVAESYRKADGLSKNEALRDDILLAHDKSLTSLITKINDLCLWSVHIHGTQEELQRRLAQVDTALSGRESLEQVIQKLDHRIDKLEAAITSLCKDFAFYKQEVQHALKDIHTVLASHT
ncbi:Hypothetical protein GLP15_4031 [Giardia lamblia P15]|uniref:Uncharacterized protein n=1 Tax=Giardia intestinalis (strain P15) TaxID=658858 RepID=E1F5E7_GIAIA|nr:Hypothetical protein GLP15_4031 [Giardia lamblia P15]